MSVRQVWGRFIDYLADLGASPVIVFAVAAAAAMSLILTAYTLWLAFSLRDAPAEASREKPR